MKKILFCLLLYLFPGVIFANTEITIYNKNIGLVKETRKIKLNKGIQEYIFKRVSEHIIPESVYLKFPNKNINILEQNFEYDLVNSLKLLHKYINKSIEIYTRQNKKYSGLLLSYDPDDLVLKTKAGITIISKENILTLKFAELPEGLITKPALRWKLEAAKKGTYNIKLSYLTRNITWQADYIALLNKDDSKLDLKGWVTINNNTGLSFFDSKLLLIAGDINLIRNRPVKPEFRYKLSALPIKNKSFKEEEFFEYHLYRLPYNVDIKNNQQKQIKLLSAENIKCKKEFVYEGEGKVKIYVIFKNSNKNNLGKPLPAGKLRIYKNDSLNSMQFIGENLIDHTPEGEPIKLLVGNAFDIIGSKTVIQYKKYKDNKYSYRYKYKYKVTIKNRKKEKVTVTVKEKVIGVWKIINSSLPYTKEDAFTAAWKLVIPAKSEKTIIYEYESR